MTYDPNFPSREPDHIDPDGPNRGWTLGIGVLLVLAIIAFLATGTQHSGDQAAAPNMPPSTASTSVNPPANAPNAPGVTLPVPRNPAETTGDAPKAQ